MLTPPTALVQFMTFKPSHNQPYFVGRYFCETWFLSKILLPKKFSYSCLHGAPLLPAFIWRFLPECTFHQQKIHFLARVSSARHIQWLDVDEELLLSVSFSFSKFILPRFLAAFSACLRAAFHILQSVC